MCWWDKWQILENMFSILLSRGIDSEGLEVIRQYTPITLDSDVGYFELVVKVYLISLQYLHIFEHSILIFLFQSELSFYFVFS